MSVYEELREITDKYRAAVDNLVESMSGKSLRHARRYVKYIRNPRVCAYLNRKVR